MSGGNVSESAGAPAETAGPIPHSRTVLAEEDIEAATAVLRSGQIAETEVTRELEAQAAERLGRTHAWATTSGTAAIYTALLTMGIGDGDEILIPTYVCDDVLSSVLHAGATPVPVDIDPDDLNPDPEDAERKTGPRTRAVVLGHVLGMPARVSEFEALAVPVIEDLAHGLGGELPDGPAGSRGHCTILSFHALKMLPAGAGGMVLTDDEAIAAAYERLQDPDFSEGEFRVRSPMSNVQAAVGLSQLRRFEATLERRAELAGRYRAAVSDLRGVRPVAISADDERRSSCYRFSLVTDGHLAFDEIERRYLDQGVIVRRPVKQLSHRTLGLDPGGYPRAEELFDRIVSLPLYPSLTDGEQDAVIAATERTLG